MSNNTEQIEAKLAAYVDGELDADGVADIEKHLEANPSHRKLLEELKRLRGMVQSLPHVSAPPDVAEMLQGQLERSVLLGDAGDDPPALRIRPSRWSQALSLAAVVLLAVGLGTVVYLALPGSSPRPAVVTSQQPASPAKTDGLAPQAKTEAVSKRNAVATEAQDTAPAGKAAVTPTAVAAAEALTTPGAASMDSAGAGAVAESVATLQRDAPLIDKAKEVTPTDEDTLARTDSTESIAAPATSGPAEGNAGAVALADRREAADVETPDVAGVAVESDAGTSQPSPEQLAVTVPDVGTTTAPAGPVPVQEVVVVTAADPSAANSQVTQFLSANAIGFNEVADPPPAYALRDEVDADPEQQRLREAFHGVSVGSAEQREAQFARQLDVATKGPVNVQLPTPRAKDAQGTKLLLVKGITRKQAETLQDELNRNASADSRQQAVMVSKLDRAAARKLANVVEITLPPVDAVVPYTPPPDVVKVGDELTITVEQLIGPGVEKTNRFVIEESGTIAMPMLEPIQVQGLSLDAVRHRVVDAYRQASLIREADVSIVRDPNPTPATEPTTQQAQLEAATTTAAPAMEAAQRDDPGMDVVIVVAADSESAEIAPSDATTRESMPSTQPALEAPTTQP